MKHSAILTFIVCLCFVFFNKNGYAVPSYQSARGFGNKTVGGCGRHLTPPFSEIIKITSLEENGPNTLRFCIEQNTPRICVFEVGGVIELQRTLKIKNPYLTIAGETAPEPGILILGAGIEISSHDIIIRHLEIRPGDNINGPSPESRDALTIAGELPSYNIMADHLSLSWAIDENVSTGNKGVRDVTISNSIISESLNNSIHPKGSHGMGMLIGDLSKNISIIGNLFAHNNERNPRIKFGSSVVLADNIIYNWGGKSGWHIVNLTDSENTLEPILLVAEGNVFRPGPNSPNDRPFFAKILPTESRILLGANFLYSNLSSKLSPQDLSNLPNRNLVPKISELEHSDYKSHTGEENWNLFSLSAGTRPRLRNEIDKRIIKEVLSGRGSIKDCISGCSNAIGGQPGRKTKFRELALPIKPFEDSDGNGYLNIEDWLEDYLKKVSN